MERYKSGTTGKGSYVPKPKFEKPVFKKKEDLLSVAELNKGHPAREYIERRQIPEEYFSEIFFADRFYDWVNKQNHSLEKSLLTNLDSLSRHR